MIDNKKYNDIITAARRQFSRYGVRRVTIEDVCKEANVSKMTFYKHFHNKTGLAKTVLDILFDENAKEFKELMRSEAPFYDKMHSMVQWKIDKEKDSDSDFLREIYTTSKVNSEIGMHLRRVIRNGLNGMVNEFAAAQESGWMRRDIKPELLMAMLDKAVEIINDEKVQQLYDDPRELMSEITKLFICGITNET